MRTNYGDDMPIFNFESPVEFHEALAISLAFPVLYMMKF
jgi:hypothetical protein